MIKPSDSIEDALIRLDLHMDEKSLRRVKELSDAYHFKECPGTSRLTVACVLLECLPRLGFDRWQHEIAQACGVSEAMMRKRKLRLKEYVARTGGWKRWLKVR